MGMAQGYKRLKAAWDKVVRHMRIARRLDGKDLLRIFEPAFKAEGFREKQPGAVEQLLVISLDELGDNVLLTPFLRELRQNAPQARIVLVVKPFLRDVFELCPYINELLTLQPGFSRDMLQQGQRVIDFCEDHFWGMRFDKCFLPQWGDDKTELRLLAYLSGARERIGYGDGAIKVYGEVLEDSSSCGELLTEFAIAPAECVHEAERRLQLLRCYDMEVSRIEAELWLGAADWQVAAKLIAPVRGYDKVLALGIGAGWPGRNYPLTLYIRALRELVAENWGVVVLGGKKEQEDGDFLVEHLPPGSTVNIAGQTSLRETAAAIGLTDLYLGNDTGVMHMAAALGKPTVDICFEPASRRWLLPELLSPSARFHPWQTDYICLRPAEPLPECAEAVCYGYCAHKEVPHCISQIEPEELVEAVRMLWAHKSQTGSEVSHRTS